MSHKAGLNPGFNLPTGTIIWSASVANDDVIGGTLFPNDGQFHHIAGTYDGTVMKLFFDGPIPTASEPSFIGKQSGCGDITNADIDQIKFFDRALSDQEILSESSGFALLSGNNSFTGNQTVNGTLSATAFIGDGSSLTGIVAQSANAANTADYATSAGTAASATFAASAGDAMTFGGNLPGAFAPASGSPNYLAKGGDTMTGALSLPADGLIVSNNQLILSGASVGIGTTGPMAKLHVNNGNAVINMGGPINSGDLPDRTLMLGLRPDGQDSALGFQVSATARGSLEYNTGYGGDGSFYFWNWNNNVGWVNPLTVAATGNIGIGTKTPAANLDVNGTANFRGLVTFAPGQTFPGSSGGTITGVTAGSGLSGGGTSGNLALNNTGVLSVTGGSGISKLWPLTVMVPMTFWSPLKWLGPPSLWVRFPSPAPETLFPPNNLAIGRGGKRRH
jgi:Concanavalin A-like lectin/glucanases superfamily